MREARACGRDTARASSGAGRSARAALASGQVQPPPAPDAPQICSRATPSSMGTSFIAKAAPIVVAMPSAKEPRVKRQTTADFPMPLSPMTTTLKEVSRFGAPGAPSTRSALAPAGSGGGRELQQAIRRARAAALAAAAPRARRNRNRGSGQTAHAAAAAAALCTRTIAARGFNQVPGSTLFLATFFFFSPADTRAPARSYRVRLHRIRRPHTSSFKLIEASAGMHASAAARAVHGKETQGKPGVGG